MIATGAVSSFDDIAAQEQLAERHVRFLAPLAFLSPRIVEAIEEGSATAGTTRTTLARDLPMQWHAQELCLDRNGLACSRELS